MDNRPIGIFDSGLGGLSAVKELIDILPNENIVYFGDTGRVPYGTKSKSTILKYAKQDESFLLENDVKMVIAACGTVSSVAYDTGKDLGVPFLGVVEPACKQAVAATKKVIQSIDKDIEVYAKACSMFVSLVEEGWVDENDEITIKTAQRYLQPLKEKGVDVLILGCTHFPLIAKIIGKVMGESVTLISSGGACAKEAAQYLKNNNMLNNSEKEPTRNYYVSDTPESFLKTAKLFLNTNEDLKAKQIRIEDYGKQEN